MDDDNEVEVVNVAAAQADTTLRADRGDIVEEDTESPEALAAIASEEEEEEGQVADPAPAATTEGGKHMPGSIPKARFDEVNDKRRKAEEEAIAAKAQADELRRQLDEVRRGNQPAQKAQEEPAQPKFDMKAAERQYTEALVEGDLEKALTIRETINSHIMEAAERNVTEKVERELSARQMATALDTVSAKAVKDFPYLDTPEGEFALNLILAKRDADIRAGVPAHKALADAVENIAPKFAPAGDDASTPSRDSTGKFVKGDTRTQEAIARGARTANQQPSVTQPGVGARAQKGNVDAMNLTEEQFKNLTREEKARLRGD